MLELIDTSDRFAALEAEWVDLLSDSSNESPFLTWPWLYAWWTHFGAARRLAIVAVRDAAKLIAVAPFCISRGRLSYVRRYEWLGAGLAGSDYLDAVVRHGYELDALHTIAEFIRDADAAVHLVRLPQSSYLSRLAAPLAENGWSVRSAADGFCPFIRLSGHSWESFLSTIGPAHRATTRRRLRALERGFSMRFERITGDAMRRCALARLFEFHHARFGARGTAFQTSALRAFHSDATERLEASGVLRLFALRLNGDIAGVMYGMSFANRFYFYQHGHDPALQSHGIGRAVLDLSIRAAIQEGFAEFDLLYGGETYKSAWTRDRRPLMRLELFPARLGGRVHRRICETERVLRGFARRVISAHAPQTN
jgi:CelD/BcsL family acetyltransferase involved in cellulose biosynthesis